MARSIGSESKLTSTIGWAKGSELARVMEPPVIQSMLEFKRYAVLYPYARQYED